MLASRVSASGFAVNAAQRSAVFLTTSFMALLWVVSTVTQTLNWPGIYMLALKQVGRQSPKVFLNIKRVPLKRPRTAPQPIEEHILLTRHAHQMKDYIVGWLLILREKEMVPGTRLELVQP
jgi:hypothetical protein